MNLVLAVVVSNVAIFLSMYFLENKKIKVSKKVILPTYLISNIIVLIPLWLNIGYTKVLISLVLFVILARILFHNKWIKAILLGSYITILCIISEAFVGLILQPSFNFYVDSEGDNILLINIAISVLLVILSKIKFIQNIYRTLIDATNKTGEAQAIIVSLGAIGVYNVFSLIAYYALEQTKGVAYLAFSSTILTVVSFVIVLGYFRNKNKYTEVYEKHNLLLETIVEYEEILEKHRMFNHESKNQLAIIRSMSKNKKIIEYIDSINKYEITDDDNLILEVSRIPTGGLKGLIYSKLLIIKDKSISYELLISKKINASKLKSMSERDLMDIFMIIGVLIDNAIEAAEVSEKKDIGIEIYEEDKALCISIVNSYSGYLDIARMDNPGYTTKAKGHGYGLPLVNEILKRNRNMSKTQKIINDAFIQTLKVKN